MHTAVLGALALTQTPLNATVPLDFEPPSVDEGLHVHVEETRPDFPRADQEPTWFDGIAPLVRAPPWLEDQKMPPSEVIECVTGPHEGWAPLWRSEAPVPERDVTLRRIRWAAGECANQAAQTGWRGRGRVFVRVNRRDDGAAIATTTALGEEPRDEALLCCLRQAQTPVVAMLRPGGAVRYVLVFSPDPAQTHITLEHTAASRRGGGAEAMAMVQSAFTE